MPYIPKTTDAAVKKATGKAWKEWFGLLDKAGAKKMPHSEIARLLHQRHLSAAKSGGWWSQMVAVEYERSRGLRAVNQTATGFNVSVHRSFKVALPKLFDAWRRTVADEGLVESTVHRNKNIRYRAAKGKPQYVAAFAQKNASARIGLEVRRLQKAADVEKQRAKWKKVLDKVQRELA